MKIPESKLVKNQTKTFERTIEGKEKVKIKIRWDDECGNGHNTFAITGTQWEWGEKYSPSGRKIGIGWAEGSSGCIHEIIERVFPEFAHLIKWHHMNADGPWGYLANTRYHAWDLNCWGRRVGDIKGISFPVYDWGTYKSSVGPDSGKVVEYQRYKEGHIHFKGQSGVYLADATKDVVHALIVQHCTQAKEKDETCIKYFWCGPWWTFDYEKEGKPADLEAARHSAIWPEATLEQLRDPEQLTARLPALMEVFKKDIEELGFQF